jgi:branched-subunit amino acid aminotransferase/4-amino-4-deoxychorismate lyase
MTRPDPAAGVFETIRVEQHRALCLDDHLARLRASVCELYGIELDAPQLPPLPHEPHRLRIVATPDGTLDATLGSIPDPGPVELRPWTLPGGLGGHKWADRRLVDEATERLGATPLIVDSDGAVLEAAWGNIWALEGERLVTPPTDGRLLPGITRARLLRIAPEVVEEALTLDRLAAADAVLVTSALRMAVPAGGREAPARKIAAALLADLLSNRPQRSIT